MLLGMYLLKVDDDSVEARNEQQRSFYDTETKQYLPQANDASETSEHCTKISIIGLFL